MNDQGLGVGGGGGYLDLGGSTAKKIVNLPFLWRKNPFFLLVCVTWCPAGEDEVDSEEGQQGRVPKLKMSVSVINKHSSKLGGLINM